MPSPFSILKARCAALSNAALREEIRAHTGSDEEVSSILRSLERFGEDLSIRVFEMTPKTGGGRARGRNVAWSVRAVHW